MKNLHFISILLSTMLYCCGQSQSQNPSKNGKVQTSQIQVGGNCEGCEAVLEYQGELNWEAHLPDYQENNGQRIKISGIVFQRDGKTPAPNVILYVYHTDQKGEYARRDSQSGWGKRHGYLRAWLKTNEKGEYQFFTQVPISYPNSKIPAHIHIFIKESDKSPYYLDDYLFEDDPLLTKEDRQKAENRGGSGILKVVKTPYISKAHRNIILGLNIPDYPSK